MAAIFNAGELLNVLAKGRKGTESAEGFVASSLMALSLAMIIISAVVLMGLK